MNRTILNSPNSLVWTLVALFVLLVAVPGSARAEGDDEKDWSVAAGWMNTTAPTTTHFNVYTEFAGTRNQIADKDLDTWKGIMWFSAEVAIPGVPLSVFGDIGYQMIASGSEATGWKDPTVGAKFSLELFDFALLGIYVKGNIPIGTTAVTLDAFEATSVGASVTVTWTWLFVNAGMDFGAVWKIAQENGTTTKAFQYSFFAEAGINPPIPASGRVGLVGVLRDTGFDKDQFEVYMEGQVFMFFLRVSAPFDMQGGSLEGIRTAFESGNLKILGGVKFGF
jgi:hypothetical protein